MTDLKNDLQTQYDNLLKDYLDLKVKYNRINHEMIVSKTTISALHYAMRIMHGNARHMQIDNKFFEKYDAIFLAE